MLVFPLICFTVVDMEKVVRIQHGQMTVPFQKVVAKFGPVKQNSFSIIYTNGAGDETSLDLIAPTPDVFKYWFDGLKIILKKVRYTKENASVEERYYKLKFEAADADRSGTLDVDEVIEIIYGMNIDLSKAVIRKMIQEVDEDNNGTLDFEEFSNLLAELRRRPELEALWVTVVAGTCKQGELGPLVLNVENNAEAKTIRASTITMEQFRSFWYVWRQIALPYHLHLNCCLYPVLHFACVFVCAAGRLCKERHCPQRPQWR